jgi:hypothetical protein
MESWKIRKTFGLVAMLALTALAALYWSSLAQRPKGGDVEQVRELMVRGEQALEGRSLSAAMAVVSKHYHDESGWRRDSLRRTVGRLLQQTESVAINIPARSMRIEVDAAGRRAMVRAHVDLRAASRYDSDIEQSLDLTLQFVKEPARYYGLFPGEEWRLVQMEGWQGASGAGESEAWTGG